MKEYLKLAYGSSIFARFLLGLIGVKFDKSYSETQAEAREYMKKNVWQRGRGPDQKPKP